MGVTPKVSLAMRVMKAVIEMFDRVEKEVGSVEVVVFNTGAQHRCSILNMTARVYRQVWESATFQDLLRAARRRGEWLLKAGTILFTGATASVRGGANFASFAPALYALRALAQSMARELGPKGIHVGHVIVDGMIDSEAVRMKFPEETSVYGRGYA